MRKGIVTFKNNRVGSVWESSDSTIFEYNDDCRSPIACAFPELRRAYEWATGLHPVFENMTAEGPLRERQARASNIDKQDPLGLLIAYGADCIGAIGLEPEDAATVDPADHSQAIGSSDAPTPGRTISGQQPKAICEKLADGEFAVAAPNSRKANWIAKFAPADEGLATLLHNENLTLDLFRTVLGRDQVAEATRGFVAEKTPALMVKRFDRTEAGEKLRMEDFAQILMRPRGMDGKGKYNGSHEEIAAAIDNHSSRALLDKLELFRRLVLFVLVGNCDGHLNNWALLETPTGLRISPVYDVAATALYSGFDTNIGLSILGDKPTYDTITRNMLIEFGTKIGLQRRAVVSAFTQIGHQIAKVDWLRPGDGTDQFLESYVQLVRGQCARLFE